VDWELSDEQRSFRQTLRDFADKEIIPVVSEWEETGSYPAEFVVERLYRDAPLMAIGVGTNDAQRLGIARALASGPGRLDW
jgi:alkylation response protein AidB-like acyl-CoA dehydrogenase